MSGRAEGTGMPDDAAGWLARLRSGVLGEAEQRAFDAWLLEAENRAAFESLSRIWSDLESVRAHPAVLTMRECALAAHELNSRLRWKRGLAAVAAVCVLAVGAVYFHFGTTGPRTMARGIAMDYATRVGQKSTLTLSDGSLVVLDTDSAIRAWSTAKERRVTLSRGRAFFDVAKDPTRPFSITAGGNTVTAVGTSFDVELRTGAMEVTLVTGHLRIRRHDSAATAPDVEMHAGQRLVASDDTPWTLRDANAEAETGWLRGQLVFDEETLAHIAAALNRYSTKKIVIDDPDVAGKRLSAVLVAGDIDSFIQATDTLGLARVGANDSRHVELVAP